MQIQGIALDVATGDIAAVKAEITTANGTFVETQQGIRAHTQVNDIVCHFHSQADCDSFTTAVAALCSSVLWGIVCLFRGWGWMN